MTNNNPDTTEQNRASATWWTPKRMKLAGICGLIGGLGGLLIARFPIGSTGLGIEPTAVGLLYPIWYVLFAVALLGANARYGTSYGRSGRYLAILLGLSLLSYAGSTIILVVGNTVTLFEEFLTPIGFLAGFAYLVIRLLGCLYGISLWRHTSASRLTAGLFIISFPAIFVFGVLNQLGFPDVLIIGTTLYLAFIALSYDLWRVDGDTSVRDNTVTEQ